MRVKRADLERVVFVRSEAEDCEEGAEGAEGLYSSRRQLSR